MRCSSALKRIFFLFRQFVNVFGVLIFKFLIFPYAFLPDVQFIHENGFIYDHLGHFHLFVSLAEVSFN